MLHRVSIIELKGIVLDNRLVQESVQYIPFADLRIIQLTPDDKESLLLKSDHHDYVLNTREFDQLTDDRNVLLWSKKFREPTFYVSELLRIIIEMWLNSITGRIRN